jgi:D-glycero-alpha-D-manno-heptose-7-phosphate kinase
MTENAIIQFRAPLRIGLAGGGTDIPPYVDIYGSEVLNCTINLYVHGQLVVGGSELLIRCRDSGAQFKGTDISQLTLQGPLAIQQAVYLYFIENHHQGKFIHCSIDTWSEVRFGSGLGASSALTVALIKGFCELLNVPNSSQMLARTAYDIERTKLNLKGGLQDQYAAAFGGFNHFSFLSQYDNKVTPLTLSQTMRHVLESQIVLIDSQVLRSPGKAIEAQSLQIKQCNALRLNYLHNIRTSVIPMAQALIDEDIMQFWSLFNIACEQKHRLGEAILPSSIARLFEFVMEQGALAGKVCGAGGGGFMLFALPYDKANTIKAKIRHSYCSNIVQVKIVEQGAQAIKVKRNVEHLPQEPCVWM